MRYDVIESDSPRLDVFPERRDRPISRRLFGKFTEHLGENVYNGIWAQILRNPGFEAADKFGAESLPGWLEAFGRRCGVADLAGAPGRGVAPYWLPAGDGGAYGLDRRAFNSDHCQRIRRSSRTGWAGVAQPIFLPLHRVGVFELSLWARSRSVRRLRVAVLGNGKVLSEAVVDGVHGRWTKYTARLAVRRTKARPDRVFALRIRFRGAGTVWLDQASLFPADHVGGFDPDVIRLWREARLPLLRFPGGNFASGYHWRDGVGPAEQRVTRRNPAWAGAEYNHVGTDEMMALCGAIGCEPMICVNAGSGTADEAAAWVDYCNGAADTPNGAARAANGHPAPYGVRLWEIGNELYGKWQIGHCTASEYARRYARFTRAMRAADPGIEIIANGDTPEWNAAVVRRNPRSVRSFSTHPLIGGAVPEGADPADVFDGLMGYAHRFPLVLRELARPMRRAGLTPRIAVTEMQVFTHRAGLPNNRTLAEAVWTASMIHAAIRSRGLVELVTHSALVNHGGCVLKECEFVWPEPVYFVHQLYGTQSGTVPLQVRFAGPSFAVPHVPTLPRPRRVPALNAVALANEAGTEVTLIVVNCRARGGVRTRVRLHGWDARSGVRVRELSGESFLSANTLDAPSAIELRARTARARGGALTHTFPPHSVTELVFRAGT